jgi:hypothetical protein
MQVNQSMSYSLRSKFGDLSLARGTYVIGRSRAAHLVIDDARVSRKHASVSADENGLTVRDLGSHNGVHVNGRRVSEANLKVGDRILIGEHDIEVVAVSAAPKVTGFAPTVALAAAPAAEEDGAWVTRRADALEMMASAAETALKGGRTAVAERMLQGPLKGGLKRAQLGEAIPADRAARMATLALGLASALKKPEWVHYVLELYTGLKSSCGETVAQALQATIVEVPSLSKPTVRGYLTVLRALPPEPATRSLIMKLEEIERSAKA